MRLAASSLALALLGCSADAPNETATLGAGELVFSVGFGTTGDDFARSVAVDPAGDAYVAGYTAGAFEGAENAGAWDAFVTRSDASGELAWSAQWGSDAAEFAQAVLLGVDGAVFVAGYGQGELGGESLGGHDAFLTRFEPSAERGWTRQWGTPADDFVYAAASSGGDVVVAGYTEGAFAGAENAGEADAFVARYDASGEPVWIRQWGTSATDYAQAVHGDARGNVLVAGYTAGTLGEDQSSGAEDVFLVKLDATGELVWLRQWGSATTDYGLSVTSDEAGNSYVTGYTYGAVMDQPSAGGEDAFLSKLDAEGRLLWTRQWGTRSADSARSVSLAPNGDVLVAGDTEGALDGQSSAGERDAFLVRFAADGEPRFVAQWGGAEREFSLSVTATARDVFVAGYSESMSLAREALLTKWTF